MLIGSFINSSVNKEKPTIERNWFQEKAQNCKDLCADAGLDYFIGPLYGGTGQMGCGCQHLTSK
jgi:hypothetical protein